MNKVIYAIAVFFISFLLLNSTKANAQVLFGADEETFKNIIIELKKINVRLVDFEKTEMVSLRNQLEEVLRQIEEVKITLPQLQGQVDEIKNALPQDSIGDVIDQINAQNKRLDDTNSIFRSELIPTIDKKIKSNQIKVDLANEKLNRLMEILKAVVDKQIELEEEQETHQSIFKTSQQDIMESLADIRRKSNINISRNEDIKKMLREIKKNN
jgi:hypothetical protein